MHLFRNRRDTYLLTWKMLEKYPVLSHNHWTFLFFLTPIFSLSANCLRSRMSCRRCWRSKQYKARNSVRRRRSCFLSSSTNRTPAHLFTYLLWFLQMFPQADLVSALPSPTLDLTDLSLVCYNF